MTMEFLTLSDARVTNPHKIAGMIMQTVIAQSELLRRLSWTITDKNTFEYERVVQKAEVKTTTVIAALCQMVRKISTADGTIPSEDTIIETTVDMARNLEKTVIGGGGDTNWYDPGLLVRKDADHVDAPSGIMDLIVPSYRIVGDRVFAGTQDMDKLIVYMGRYWRSDECVFLMDSNLRMRLIEMMMLSEYASVCDPDKLTWRGNSVIPVDGPAFAGKIACVSLNPERGLFGIVRGKPNALGIEAMILDKTVNEYRMVAGEPAMGWHIKAMGPARDFAGQESIISWTGSFGIRNEGSAVSIDGLTVPSAQS